MGLIAVVPAAGLGTRMSTISAGTPKELLSVGGKPVLHWVIEECLAAGAERVAVVGSPRKPEIDDFVANLSDDRLSVVHQAEPLGLADAVRRGLEMSEAALVPMPDYIFPSGSPSNQLAEAVQSGFYGAAAVHEVPLDQVNQYGIVGFDLSDEVDRVVEKPRPEEAPSRWAVAGRFGLSAEAANDLLQGNGQAANLVELFSYGLERGKRIRAVRLAPSDLAFDCGNPAGYQAAISHFKR